METWQEVLRANSIRSLDLLAAKGIPATEPFAYMPATSPWVGQHWLYEFLLAKLADVTPALASLAMGTVALTAFLIALRTRPRNSSVCSDFPAIPVAKIGRIAERGGERMSAAKMSLPSSCPTPSSPRRIRRAAEQNAVPILRSNCRAARFPSRQATRSKPGTRKTKSGTPVSPSGIAFARRASGGMLLGRLARELVAEAMDRMKQRREVRGIV